MLVVLVVYSPLHYHACGACARGARGVLPPSITCDHPLHYHVCGVRACVRGARVVSPHPSPCFVVLVHVVLVM